MSRLQQIRARLEAATPGPWEMYSSNEDYLPITHSVITSSHGDMIAELNEKDRATFREGELSSEAADTWFIANARSDVEALLEAVEGVLAHVEACEEVDIPVDGAFIRRFIQKKVGD